MKILHVTMGIDPASGGPTRSVTGLCRSLAIAGEDITLYVLHAHHVFNHPNGVKVLYAEDLPFCDFKYQLKCFDLIHIQGLWDWQLHKFARLCRHAHIPYIISPRGMLDPWALSVKKWKKRIALFLYQRHDLQCAWALHVTADMEREHAQALGFTQPIIVAPNGVEVPAALPEKTWGDPKFPHRAIFLSRLHPGKGLLTLAEAWAKVHPIGWQMMVVGPDNYGHKAEVIARLIKLGIMGEWQFLDTLNDIQKWSAYRSADLLIHPSVSENFGITIAEGLYAELPVIATKGTPWKDLVDYKCGWWIDQGVDALANALRAATSTANLNLLGQNGHKLILKKYCWPAIAQTMINGYKEVLKNVQ